MTIIPILGGGSCEVCDKCAESLRKAQPNFIDYDRDELERLRAMNEFHMRNKAELEQSKKQYRKYTKISHYCSVASICVALSCVINLLIVLYSR